MLAEWAREECERWHVPGLAVGLLRDGEVETAAAGVRDLERAEPVHPETPFRIASATKPFTATLVMTLAQEGRLSLDEPPPGTAARATIRQLLSHQGGLEPEWSAPLDGLGDDDEALARLVREEPPSAPVKPGALFAYSNVGYWTVGAAVARVCGTTFEEAMRTRVLEPLSLADTGFNSPPGAARGHNQVAPGADEHRPADSAYPRVRRPSGGLWSTVGDLLKFAAHHLGSPGPLSRRSVTALQEPQVATTDGSYGLGWMLGERGGRQVVHHPGSAAGFQSLLLLVPDEQLALAALANSSRGNVAIRGLLERLDLARETVADATVREEELAAIVGVYRGQGYEAAVRREQGRLVVELVEVDPFREERVVYPPLRARPVGPREFELEDGDWRGERIDFPRPGLMRYGVLAEKVE